MIIDGWGKILAEAEDEPDIQFAELNKKHLEDTRELLPALKNRRL